MSDDNSVESIRGGLLLYGIIDIIIRERDCDESQGLKKEIIQMFDEVMCRVYEIDGADLEALEKIKLFVEFYEGIMRYEETQNWVSSIVGKETMNNFTKKLYALK